MSDQRSTADAVAALGARFNGEIVLPDDAGYDELREHFNKLYDKRPAVIARPVGTADVVATVQFARSAGLEIAVSSGGKHGAGFSRTDGGIVVDMSLMRGVAVDPETRTAWLQGGANGGDLQAEALVHGLGGVIGWMRGTGVGGVNIQGGFGMLTSKLGWGADTILEVELVTADGRVLRLSDTQYPDLFWAVRGAGGNFGIVTWVKQRLTPVPPEILAGQLIYGAEAAPKVLDMLDEFTFAATDDLTVFGSYTVVPVDPNYPAELHGRPAFVLTIVHIGDRSQAERDLRPLRELQPALDLVAPQGLYDFLCSMDAYIVAGRQWYDSVELEAVSPTVIGILGQGARALADLGLEGEIVVVPHGRGRDPQISNAVRVGRPGSSSIVAAVYWHDPGDDQRAEEWSTNVVRQLRESGLTLDAVYGNMANPLDTERDRRSYGEENWKRLTELKKKYDPENVFHLNHNIPPAS